MTSHQEFLEELRIRRLEFRAAAIGALAASFAEFVLLWGLHILT
jgi:hypothetical protein